MAYQLLFGLVNVGRGIFNTAVVSLDYCLNRTLVVENNSWELKVGVQIVWV